MFESDVLVVLKSFYNKLNFRNVKIVLKLHDMKKKKQKTRESIERSSIQSRQMTVGRKKLERGILGSTRSVKRT